MRSECINWTGVFDAYGYGQLPRRSKFGRKAHRKAFYDAYGHLPPVVMHTCDNRACVNPEHLRSGTIAENNRDMHAKGRGSKPPRNDHRGEKAPWAKLTWAKVRKIRKALRSSCNQRRLAESFGVSPALITRIKQKKVWT